MASLTGPYYYGIVVGTMVDPACIGAVQAKILGVTDDWKDELQPWVYPQLGYGMQSVPQNGQYLLVHFLDGDINQGMYYGVSQSKSFLPDEFMAEYPDVAYANLGELGFTYVHNRFTHTTKIKNSGNGGTIVWDPTGALSVEADSITSETDMPSYPVLTEATIDVFTCRPIGDKDTIARQGSEYLKVSHISQHTVNVVRGAADNPPTKIPESPVMPSGGEIREIIGVDDNGNDRAYTIPYEESPAVSPRMGNRVPKRILIGGTSGKLLSKMIDSFMEDGSTLCSHFLVGSGDGDPDVLSNISDELQAKNRGFIQFAEIKDDTKFGSDMSGAPNVGAVTVMFYTDSLGKLGNSDYAFAKLMDIVHHVKKTYELDEIEVVAYDGNALDYLELMEWEGEY